MYLSANLFSGIPSILFVQARLDEATAATAMAQDAAATAERALAAERRFAEALAAESNAQSAAVGSSSAVAADLLKRVAALDAQVIVLRAEAEDATRERGILAQQLDSKAMELQRIQADLAALRAAEATARAAAADAAARAAELNAALEVVGLELGTSKQAQMEAEAAASTAVARDAALTASVAEWRAKAEDLSVSVERLTAEVAALEVAAAEAAPRGGRAGKGSLESMRAAKVETDRVLEKVAGDLRDVTAARDAALAAAVEAQRTVASLREDLAESARRIDAANVARDAAAAALSVSHAETDEARLRLREALDASAAAAAAAATEAASLKARATAAEDDAAAARGARGALEKALRTANADLAETRAKVEELAAAVAAGVAEKDVERERVAGARTERDVITSVAEESLRQRDVTIAKMREAQRQLQLKERRRAEVDAAVEVVRAGAEVTKYKLSGGRLGGQRVSVEQRWLVVLPLTTVAPGIHLPAVGNAGSAAAPSGDTSGNLTVDALCWREVTRKKTFSKAIRFADIAAVVMGTRSPVFQVRLLSSGGRGVAGTTPRPPLSPCAARPQARQRLRARSDPLLQRHRPARRQRCR